MGSQMYTQREFECEFVFNSHIRRERGKEREGERGRERERERGGGHINYYLGLFVWFLNVLVNY